jgi:hypothetical protein
MDFQITDTKPINKNTLRGVFSLVVGPMKIEGFTFHVKNGKSWIGFPSRQYVDQESGEIKYYPIIYIEDKDRYLKFQKWCKDQLKGVFDAPTAVPEPKPEQAGFADQDSIPF